MIAGKRLVIFGCGYVGEAVARAALAGGARVTALTRNAAKAGALRAMGVDVVVERLDSDAWYGAISPDADFVLNAVSSAGGGLDGYRQSYVDGNASIVAWARQGRIGTYVYTSSTSVYPYDDGRWVDEQSDTAGCGPRAEILLEAERLIRESADVFGRYFILRLAGIYGPGRHIWLDKLRAGENAFPGDGLRTLNLVHRDDIVTAVLNAFEAPDTVRNAIFNIADDSPGPQRGIVAWLAEELGLPAPEFRPEQAQERAGRRGLPGGGLPDRRIANTSAREHLGWAPQYGSFREGYRAILRNP